MKLKITIGSKIYEVDVEAEEDAPQPTAAPFAPAVMQPVSVPIPVASGGVPTAVSDDKVCRSPIVGVVLSIHVHEGQAVQHDDPILILEAMKMETTITSPVSGKVKRISVAAGESVQAGQVLVEFE